MLSSLLALPAIFGAGLSFVFLSSKVIRSMALANLLPTKLSNSYGEENVAYNAMLVSTLLGLFASLLLCFIEYDNVQYANLGYDVAILSSYSGYIAQIYGYIRLKIKLRKLERRFRSPFGYLGALLAILIFFVGTISVIGFQV